MAVLGVLINCREFDEFIVNYLDGSLPARQRLAFKMHLAACSTCRNYLKQYRKTMSAAQNAMSALEERHAAVPDDLVRAVLSAKAADTGKSSPP
jgi:anti-sigma factor RsiW